MQRLVLLVDAKIKYKYLQNKVEMINSQKNIIVLFELINHPTYVIEPRSLIFLLKSLCMFIDNVNLFCLYGIRYICFRYNW